MPTLHLVPHTHWDREWYRSFEDFRFRLVTLIDSLLNILDNDPDYRYFMLDGQTIVLEDYLQIRPENESKLKQYILNDRIQIGPWYILPDEFLVSPEATIRNLLIGREICKQYGKIMPVGYIPDPFGHIGQMPQILQGFGIDAACLWRGMQPAPSELFWESPDGSQVFLSNLRESYSNAWDVLIDGIEGFSAKIQEKEAALASYTAAPHRLLMFGTDHQIPDARTSEAIKRFQAHPVDEIHLIHSNLPAYIQAVREWLNANNLEEQIPVIHGELRTSPYINLLPGVLSTRMWIKQRNAFCEDLLEKWAEPASVFADWIQPEGRNAESSKGYLRYAWRLLIQNHPHDSICGCSIDSVHEEMRTRFTKVEQVGWNVANLNLEAITQQVDTRLRDESCFASLVVFNPLQNNRTDVVKTGIYLPPAVQAVEVLDPDGKVIPCSILKQENLIVAHYEVDRNGLIELTPILQGNNGGYGIQAVGARKEGKTAIIEVEMLQEKPSKPQAVAEGLSLLQNLLADDTITHFSIDAHTANHAEIQFIAPRVPSFGYKVFGLKAIATATIEKSGSFSMENSNLKVEVDPQNGTLTLTDFATGVTHPRLHFFTDGGDVGDEYNYAPPENDSLITSHLSFKYATKVSYPDHDELKLLWVMQIPESASADRKNRISTLVPLEINSRVSLYPGINRLDFETTITQHASDHRLRVHFPVPFTASTAYYDGHFEIIERPVLPPLMEADWIEQRRPEVPQRAFTDLTDGNVGLMLAVRGLPEVAVQHRENGNLEVALTLLRCVGWISRDDFSTRKGHAGPMLATPGAQMHGNHVFAYSLIPHAGKWDQAMAEGYGFNTPMIGVISQQHEGSIRSTSSFIQIEPDDFHITAIKPTEEGKDWILRGVNLTDKPLKCRVNFHLPLKEVCFASLAEEPLEDVPVSSENSISFDAPPHKVISLRISNH
jgi:alpha-mannosidase